jgi:hypothetical protein
MRRIVASAVGSLLALSVIGSALASAAPDVVTEEICSDSARARLVLTDVGDRIKVRFEVHRSPVGHSWRIVLRHGRVDLGGPNHGQVKFEGTRVASVASLALTIIGPTIISLWVLVMGVLMGRRATRGPRVDT